MVDLGHGVHLVPDEPDRRRGPGPPRVLTCPRCAATRGFLRVGHPGGDWLCGCGVLFDGDTREWWVWETRRDQFLVRRQRGHDGSHEAPEAASTNTTTGVSSKRGARAAPAPDSHHPPSQKEHE